MLHHAVTWSCYTPLYTSPHDVSAYSTAGPCAVSAYTAVSPHAVSAQTTTAPRAVSAYSTDGPRTMSQYRTVGLREVSTCTIANLTSVLPYGINYDAFLNINFVLFSCMGWVFCAVWFLIFKLFICIIDNAGSNLLRCIFHDVSLSLFNSQSLCHISVTKYTWFTAVLLLSEINVNYFYTVFGWNGLHHVFGYDSVHYCDGGSWLQNSGKTHYYNLFYMKVIFTQDSLLFLVWQETHYYFLFDKKVMFM